MKKLMAVSLMIILGMISIGWATWGGWVKDRYGEYIGYADVYAMDGLGGENPHTITNAQGTYALDYSRGMIEDRSYDCVYITYGIGGSTQGGVFHESQYVTKNIQEGQYYQDTK